MSGAVSYHGGLAAEDAVLADYERRGHSLAARRWRSDAGEIDLILRKGGEVVFVEVKRARNFATAAQRLSPAQMARILTAAEIFLEGEPDRGLTPCRFDVALVDGQGAVEILENVMAP